MFYMITTTEGAPWRMKRSDLVRLLEQDWPGVRIKIRDNPQLPAADVEWEITTDGRRLEGSQDRSGQTQYLEGAIEDVASFAVWWRKQVPGTQELTLCDESYETVVPLGADVSREQVLAAFG